MEKFKEGSDLFEKKDSNSEGRGEHKFAKEMEKPREEWSKEFKSFVDKKIRENKLENQQDELIEILEGTADKRKEDWSEKEKDAHRKRKEFVELQKEDEKETVDMYFDDLELTEGEISSKKIIDIGCGRNAELVEYAVEKLNSKNVYGLDRNFENAVLQKYPRNLYKGNYHESLSVDNSNLIIARASIDIKDLMKESFLENILNSLSEEGEFRVYPIFKNHFESNYKEALAVEDELIKTLDKFSKQLNFDYELKTKEVSVYGKDEYPTSKSLLIIKKKENK